MRALVIDSAGSAEQLRMAEIAEPAAQVGQVKVRIAAAGLNPADWKIIERGWPSWSFPKTAGLDGAGIVEAVGPGVEGWRAGQRVYWHGRFAQLGAFADAAAVDADLLCEVPEGLSLQDAAALPTAGFTAFQIVEEKVRPRAGDTALVNAAAGGVGIYAMQLLRARGVRIVAVCSGANADYVRDYGAHEVIDYRQDDVVAKARSLLGAGGADVIIDPMGPQSAGRMLSLLAYGGHLACVTGMPDAQALAQFPRGRTVHDIALGWAYLSENPRAIAGVRAVAGQVARLAAVGQLRMPIEARVPLEGLRAALLESKSGHQRGRIVGTVHPHLR